MKKISPIPSDLALAYERFWSQERDRKRFELSHDKGENDLR